jgi:type IX secretion system PorP/SprF family membrane protein
MKHFFFIAFATLYALPAFAQQLPDYTHYPSLMPILNPAYTGTRGTVDARVNYRAQWIGFDDAPVQQTAIVHSRFLKGKLGIGASYYNDITGPSRRMVYGGMLAYHLRMPDIEFSAGIGISQFNYFFNSNRLTQYWQGDPALVQGINAVDKKLNPSAGLLLYNDRFHFGLGMINLLQPKALLGGAVVRYENHYYFSFGYNYGAVPGFVWENNILATYTKATPLSINYNLRLHIRKKVIIGTAWRLRDAVALQAGFIVWNNLQFVYSYDLGLSKLRGGHSGSHEATLSYRFDLDKQSNFAKNMKQFRRQKYDPF